MGIYANQENTPKHKKRKQKASYFMYILHKMKVYLNFYNANIYFFFSAKIHKLGNSEKYKTLGICTDYGFMYITCIF